MTAATPTAVSAVEQFLTEHAELVAKRANPDLGAGQAAAISRRLGIVEMELSLLDAEDRFTPWSPPLGYTWQTQIPLDCDGDTEPSTRDGRARRDAVPAPVSAMRDTEDALEHRALAQAGVEGNVGPVAAVLSRYPDNQTASRGGGLCRHSSDDRLSRAAGRNSFGGCEGWQEQPRHDRGRDNKSFHGVTSVWLISVIGRAACTIRSRELVCMRTR